MSFLSAVKSSSLVATIDPRTYRSGMNDFWLFGAGPNNTDVLFSFGSLKDSIKAYECCPPVATIVNRKAEAHINGKVWLLNTQGKARDKVAAGEVAGRINKVLAQPNPLQDWMQFDAMVKVYVQLFGYCPILKIKPVGFDGSYITRLWIIPPFLLDIEENEEIFYRTDKPIKKITLTYKGKTANLDPDDIFFIKDFTVSLSSYYLPQSRLKSLETPIGNIVGAFVSRKVLINRRGALGILSNAGKDSISQIPLDPKEKKKVQDELMNYGLRADQWQVIVTNAALQWQQMGYPTKDLMLFEEVDGSTQTICDGLGYIYRLLSSEKSNSLGGSDVKEFKAMLYTDFIIPEAVKIYEQYNRMFDTAKYSLRLEKDFSEVPALQKDAVQQANALFTRNKAFQIAFMMNACTINEWRTKNGDDPITATKVDGVDFIDWPNMYYFQLVQAGFKFGGSGNSGGGNNNNNNDPNQENSNDNGNSGN
jgi:hypothetical protein